LKESNESESEKNISRKPMSVLRFYQTWNSFFQTNSENYRRLASSCNA